MYSRSEWKQIIVFELEFDLNFVYENALWVESMANVSLLFTGTGSFRPDYLFAPESESIRPT